MTGKRFTHKRWYDERQLFDGETPFAIVDIYIQAENICNKLNELAEKNQNLFDDLQNKTSWLSLRGAELDILKRENEQLKSENKKLNERIGILEGSLIDKGFDIND